MNYRPEIDGLRAIAVLPVILFHAHVNLFQGGFVGADIFCNKWLSYYDYYLNQYI